MKFNKFSLSLAFVSLLFINVHGQKEQKYKGTYKTFSDTVLFNTSRFYHLYIPKNSKTKKLVIFIAPDGKVAPQVNQLKAFADSNDLMVAGSELIGSQRPFNFANFNRMIEDIENRMDIYLNQVYIIGHQVGARFALYYSNDRKFAGVMSIGTGVTTLLETDFSELKAWYGLVGVKDRELISFSYLMNQDLGKRNHIFVDICEETLEWPPIEDITRGLTFLMYRTGNATMDDFKNACASHFDDISSNYPSEYVQTMKDYMSKHRNQQLTQSLNEHLIIKDTTLADSALLYALNDENHAMNEYKQIIKQNKENLDWWKNEIKGLNEIIKNAPNSFEAHACIRKKEFIQTSAFLHAAHAFSEKRTEEYERIKEILSYVAPNSTDYWMLTTSEIYAAGNLKKAKKAYAKAVKSGYTDEFTAKKAYPEFFE